MKPVAHGRDSLSYPAPPRGEVLVVREESHSGDHELHRAWVELSARLPPPFQRVLEVRFEPEKLEVFLARFIGVEGPDLLRALQATGRVLPVDVGLTLAHAWGDALLQVPVSSDGWKTPVHLAQLGVDVRGELVLTFDNPNLVIGRTRPNTRPTTTGPYWNVPESISPEVVRGLPMQETARVYSLALSLLSLLEGRRLFENESMFAMLGDIALKGLSWSTPRNPAIDTELEQVFRRATATAPVDRYSNIPEFLAAFTSASKNAAATPARMIDVLLGISPDILTCLEKLEPESLPQTWREGGLQVLTDRLLERLVPITSLPEAQT